MLERYGPVLDREEMGGFYQYPDLAIGAFNVTTNHEERRICVTADIVNLRAGLPAADFVVMLQIATYFDQSEPFTGVTQYWGFPAHATFPFRTNFACMRLQYINEGGSFYQIFGIVDIGETVVDPNRNNNVKSSVWYPFSPNFAPGAEGFRVETSRTKGKTNTKYMLGDKPYKPGKE